MSASVDPDPLLARTGEKGEDPEVLEQACSVEKLGPNDSVAGGEVDGLGRISFPANRRFESQDVGRVAYDLTATGGGDDAMLVDRRDR